MATNVTNMGQLHVLNTELTTLGGCWLGGESPLEIDARNPADATQNHDDSINLKLTYGAGVGASKLEVNEFGATTGLPAVANLIISGVRDPTISSGMATKKYVDDQTTDIFQVHPPVRATSDGTITPASFTAGTDNGTSTPATLSFNAAVTSAVGGEWAAGDSENTNVRCDDVLLVQHDRVFIKNSIGNTVSASDGIWKIGSVSGNGNYTVNLVRVDDAKVFTPADDSQFTKGEFVVVLEGTQFAGNGYTLFATVVAAANVQTWNIFSTKSALTFTPPIEHRDTLGAYTIAGPADNSNLGYVITGGDGGANGAASVTKTIGASGNLQACTLASASTQINDLGSSIYDGPVMNVVTPAIDLTSSVSITIDATTGFWKTWANANHFAKLPAGTTVQVGAPSYNDSKVNGHISPATSQFTNLTESYGSGVLFNSVADFGGTNTNRSRFLMTQHLHAATNSSSLDILGFLTGGTGALVTLAQIVPP